MLSMNGFNPNRIKVLIKLALNRLKLLQEKKTALNLQARSEIAALLDKGKEESARIKVENIIREDLHVEALELLELYTEVLHARLGLLDSVPLDSGLLEAAQTIIYAAPRCDVKELTQVRDQLLSKFGREFTQAAMENTFGTVNARVVDKLRIDVPSRVLVNSYLVAIAKAYKIDWDLDVTEDDAAADIEEAEDFTHKLKEKEGKMSPSALLVSDDDLPPFQSNPNLAAAAASAQDKQSHPGDRFDTTSGTASAQSILPRRGKRESSNASHQTTQSQVSSVPDFDALSARFEALKKRM